MRKGCKNGSYGVATPDSIPIHLNLYYPNVLKY